jgi:hypothetical protein
MPILRSNAICSIHCPGPGDESSSSADDLSSTGDQVHLRRVRGRDLLQPLGARQSGRGAGLEAAA